MTQMADQPIPDEIMAEAKELARGVVATYEADGWLDDAAAPIARALMTRDQIGGAVLAWMIEHEWLDPGQEYGALDVISALEDNAGAGLDQ